MIYEKWLTDCLASFKINAHKFHTSTHYIIKSLFNNNNNNNNNKRKKEEEADL